MKMFYDKKADEKWITFVDKQDAENVLRQMKEVAEKFFVVTVADVNDLIGRGSESSFIDTYHGWWSDELPEKVEQVQTNIFHAPVYAIKLPKPKNLRAGEEEEPRKWQKNARPKDGYLSDLFLSELNRITDSPEKRAYNNGYKDGYKACAKEITRKFEEMLAQMKKELEEAEA